MRNLLTFVCPELELTYEQVYAELAMHLEVSAESLQARFAPDDAGCRLRYHRRQSARRAVFTDLASELGVDAATVFTAVSADGARILLDALKAKKAPELVITTRAAGSPVAIAEPV